MLGLTNLSGNDFITLYRLPYYHVIGVRADPYWPFKNMSLSNCRGYGCGSVAEVVCASSVYGEEVPWLAIGSIIIHYCYWRSGHSLFNASGYVGPDGSDLHLALRVKTAGYLAIQRHYADFTYDLSRRAGPILVENSIPAGSFVNVDPQGYLSVLDVLYPTFAKVFDSSVSCQLFAAAAALLEQAVNGNEIWEVLLLPFIQQQGLGVPSYEEPILNASFRRQSYKISVARSSTQIFISFTLTILVFCLIVMLLSHFDRIPEISSCTEFDIIAKMTFKDKTPEAKLSSQIFERKPHDMVKAMSGVRLHVKERKRIGGMDDCELADRGIHWY